MVTLLDTGQALMEADCTPVMQCGDLRAVLWVVKLTVELLDHR
jgi:hypothetical protein